MYVKLCLKLQQGCLFRYSWSIKDFVYLSIFYKFGKICITKRMFIYKFILNLILFDETPYISCMMKRKPGHKENFSRGHGEDTKTRRKTLWIWTEVSCSKPYTKA